MNKCIKKYVKALKNTKRKQCFGHLAYKDCRCAAGVILEDVFDWKYIRSKESGRNVWINENGIQVKQVFESATDLIDSCNSWITLDITHDNDVNKLSFKEIAKEISR